VQAHGRLTVDLVQAQGDERVLVGELGQTSEERRSLRRVLGLYQGLEGGGREAVAATPRRPPEGVADPRGQPAHDRDVAGPSDGTRSQPAWPADGHLGHWHGSPAFNRNPVSSPKLA